MTGHSIRLATNAEDALKALSEMTRVLSNTEVGFYQAADIAMRELQSAVHASAALLAVPGKEGADPVILAQKNVRGLRAFSATLLRNTLASENQNAVITTPPDSSSVARLVITSVLCVPVWHDNRSVGAIYLDRRGPGAPPFDETACRLAVCFARSLAPAIVLLGGVEQDRARLQRMQADCEEARSASAHLLGMYSFGTMATQSHAFSETLRNAERAAHFDVDVLLMGEQGTGKEHLARAIHTASARAAGRFIPVSCIGIHETIIETDLFGAPSPRDQLAAARRPGAFEQASGGTIFLDDFDGLPQSVQPKVLRAIETRRIYPTGGSEEVPVNVRVIAATTADLFEEIERGSLREDLLFHLNKMTIDLPSLRDRAEDVPLLAEHFLRLEAAQIGRTDLKGFDAAALRRLSAYDWPGNLRELKSVIGRGAILSKGPMIRLGDVAPSLAPFGRRRRERIRGGMTLRQRVIKYEVDLIRSALTQTGTIASAARLLGVRRQALQQRCRRLGIDAPRTKGGEGDDEEE
ncbi:MAG: sigma-54-dependent Fis family transcriptional regulator [Candidatus Schekmanbacteria bacterium]|nr:sigma-54-dependent Fis family transcriptional regulator [Candidatus Schekmanbacteria bacterium]